MRQNVLTFSKYINQKYDSTRNSKALLSLQHQVFEHPILRGVSSYAISFCAISLQRHLKIYTTFRIHAIIFGLERFGINDP